MIDRPILFSAPMVRALLDGRKTQTRRLCAWANNPASPALTHIVPCDEPGWFGDEEGEVQFKAGFAPGDRLWVKETWQTLQGFDHLKPTDIKKDAPIGYLATSELVTGGKTRVSIHMPRWASRMTLTVTEVRVQRLQDCSEADAIAEGIEQFGRFFGLRDADWDHAHLSVVDAYEELWDSINDAPGKRWADNPWIVAVSFAVDKRNIDDRIAPSSAS